MNRLRFIDVTGSLNGRCGPHEVWVRGGGETLRVEVSSPASILRLLSLRRACRVRWRRLLGLFALLAEHRLRLELVWRGATVLTAGWIGQGAGTTRRPRWWPAVRLAPARLVRAAIPRRQR